VQGEDFPKLKAYIEAQGSLLSLKVTGFKPRQNTGGGKRGIIRTFSRASRRRLMRFMTRLKVRKIRATFITLTFKEIVSNERAKKVFKRFVMRVKRAYENVSAVWRMEPQERGAIHFHMLCFNMPFWQQKDLQRTWEDCTEEDMSIVHIRLVHGARSVMAYISKYIAKVDNRTPTSLDDGSYQHEGEKESRAGRFWGYINKELLPLAQKLSGVLTDRATIKSLSSFMWALIGSDNPYNSVSAHLFCDNARWLCERAVEEGGMWEWECEYSTHDLTTAKQTHHVYTELFSEPELSLISVPTLGHEIKGERSEFMQPLIGGWLARSSKAVPALRLYPYFDESGIIHNRYQTKGE